MIAYARQEVLTRIGITRSTLMMYTISAVTLALRAYNTTCDSISILCFSSVQSEDVGVETAYGIITFMMLMTGILAPRLLLNIRREYYSSIEVSQGNSAGDARRTITWQIARPARRFETYVSRTASRRHRKCGT